jgi:lipopolysaccharide export system permease protein
MRILDRYVISKFVMPFIYCLVGFLAIWFIFDLADNLQDFMEGKASFSLLRDYYLTQIPEIIVMSIPVATLLALLYSLTAMSRSNEIISMLGAGVSVTRVIAPLIFIGVLLAGVSLWFNYEDAPHAAAQRKIILREIRHGELRDENLSGHLFRNREDMRTWFIRKVWLGKGFMTGLVIIQQNEEHQVTDKWYVDRAEFNPVTGQWIFQNIFHTEYEESGNEMRSIREMEVLMDGWSETPWRIASSVMNPDFLSVRELADYLDHNNDFPAARLAPYRTHWHYRWALPTFAIVVIFLAAPMGIVYSRRGILGGVAAAVILFFSMVFLSSLSLAFGKGARMPPMVAAWLPSLAFFAVGCLLLWFRSTGRELPKLKMPWT